MTLGIYGRELLPWYERDDAHDQLGDLIAWLHDTGQLNGIDDAVYICRKPWKYEAERRQMLKVRAEERAA